MTDPTTTAPRPSISVVVPALNESGSIRACLQSLAEQDFDGHVDVIVVDNGSEDATAEVARSLGAHVVHEPRRGVCRARQAGTAAARGDIVVSTDADTTFSPQWLRTIVDAFTRGGSGVVAVCGGCRFVEGPRWARAYTAVLFGTVFALFRLTGRVWYATATNIAFRRSAWRCYDVDSTQGGDELGLLRDLRRTGRIEFVRRNVTWTSSRRLHRGLVYSVLVTCLWQYLITYNVNRLANRPLLGHAPAIRRDERQAVAIQRFAHLTATLAAAAVLVGLYLVTPLDIDLA